VDVDCGVEGGGFEPGYPIFGGRKVTGLRADGAAGDRFVGTERGGRVVGSETQQVAVESMEALAVKELVADRAGGALATGGRESDGALTWSFLEPTDLTGGDAVEMEFSDEAVFTGGPDRVRVRSGQCEEPEAVLARG
jgi:hypothetical protein